MIGMMTVGFANPITTNGNTKECKETYEGIKALLDKELITIQQAQTHPTCLLYTSPSPRDRTRSRMPSSA